MITGRTEGDDRKLSELQVGQLRDLSPSAKLVYVVLLSHGTLDQDGIASRTLLPKRTIRYALDKLEAEDLVEVDHCVDDARRRWYRATVSDE